MGANTFRTIAAGKTADAAFASAVQQACHEHGHAGYTGTIAEKDGFVVIDVPSGFDPNKFAQDLLDDSDPRIDDKWGPAGCVKLADGRWMFFGWASS